MVSKVIYDIDIDKKWVKFLQGSHSDWKMGRNFPVREFWTDRKSQEKSHKILEKSGNFRQTLFIIFFVIYKWTVYYLAQVFSSKTKTFKKYWKMEKILEKSRNFFSPEKWTCLHVLSCSLYFVFTLQRKSFYRVGRNLWQGTRNYVVSAILKKKE